MLDLARIKARAAGRLAAAAPPAARAATLANPANRLTPAAPISQLATLASIDTSTQADSMVRLLCRRGLDESEAHLLADRLQMRDQSGDHRRICLECARLAGSPGRGWVCTAPKMAQVARELPAMLVMLLQDCPGFRRQGTTPGGSWVA